ncbi:chemotaxis protein CheD [Massilia sp. Root351]|jgi:chemotaxis protein CheD|uniref:chemotaxis protein CheD n=1 Tax=Massilia sp. Root351 TaxID=1736522 RepID=UPI0019110F83|nr:chemotaxis protein CheD [Massilia sp. Root351]
MARNNDIIDIFLLPGEYFVGGPEYRIRTLLGSCVSITLWHPARRVGTMSHFLLSARNSSKDPGLNSRYGEEALELMLAELRAMGVDPAECQAKIFGGSQMFPGRDDQKASNIGRQNGEVALRLLRAHAIPVVSESLYGVGHRSIIFDIRSGNVWSRQAQPEESASAAGKPALREPKFAEARPGDSKAGETATGLPRCAVLT